MEARLAALLDDYDAGSLDAAALAARWRAALAESGAALPERFVQALDRLLASVEGAALFTEESCSFSRTDLSGQLRTWLRIAVERGVLPAASAPDVAR